MKTPLTYGLGIALTAFIWTLIEFFLGWHDEKIAIGLLAGKLVYVIIAIGLWLAIKAVREASTDKALSYGKGVATGCLTSLFAGLGSAVTCFIYTFWINPGFVDVVIEFRKSKMVEQGLSDERIARVESIIRFMMKPGVQAVGSVFFCLIIGLIMSLIIAAMLKREPAREQPPTLA